MISQHDAEGRYVYASPACERLLGYSQQELIGVNAYSLFHPADLEKIGEDGDCFGNLPHKEKRRQFHLVRNIEQSN
jgi:PAS domain S-box-containing protein